MNWFITIVKSCVIVYSCWFCIFKSISFIHSINKNWHNIEPWGTPYFIIFLVDLIFTALIIWILLLDYDLNIFNASLEKWYNFSLLRSMLWSTRSKAFPGSRNLVPIPLSIWLYQSSRRRLKAVEHWCLRKQDWNVCNIYLFVTDLQDVFFLDTVSKKEIGPILLGLRLALFFYINMRNKINYSFSASWNIPRQKLVLLLLLLLAGQYGLCNISVFEVLCLIVNT